MRVDGSCQLDRNHIVYVVRFRCWCLQDMRPDTQLHAPARYACKLHGHCIPGLDLQEIDISVKIVKLEAVQGCSQWDLSVTL